MAEYLTVGDIRTRTVTFVHKNMAVDDTARLIPEHHVGALVVADETEAGRIVVGMLTDHAIVAKDLDPDTFRVEDAMSADLVTVREGHSIIDQLGTMRRKGVRRIPVVDAQVRLVGLVAFGDELEVIAQQVQLTAQAVEGGRKREPVIRA